jgi:hypothetical protein
VSANSRLSTTATTASIRYFAAAGEPPVKSRATGAGSLMPDGSTTR